MEYSQIYKLTPWRHSAIIKIKKNCKCVRLTVSPLFFQVWFKNRRAKWRKHKRESDVTKTCVATTTADRSRSDSETAATSDGHQEELRCEDGGEHGGDYSSEEASVTDMSRDDCTRADDHSVDSSFVAEYEGSGERSLITGHKDRGDNSLVTRREGLGHDADFTLNIQMGSSQEVLTHTS